MDEQNLKVTTAEEKRSKATYLHRASKNFVCRLKRMNITSLVLANLVPTHLLKAAQQYEKLQRGEGLPQNLTPEQKVAEIERLMESSPETIKGWNDFLKHYAATVVVEPKVVLGKATEPGVLSADELDGDELLSILNATPPEELKEEVAPIISPEAAEEFRRPEQPPDDSAEPVRAPISITAVKVDSPDRESIYA